MPASFVFSFVILVKRAGRFGVGMDADTTTDERVGGTCSLLYNHGAVRDTTRVVRVVVVLGVSVLGPRWIFGYYRGINGNVSCRWGRCGGAYGNNGRDLFFASQAGGRLVWCHCSCTSDNGSRGGVGVRGVRLCGRGAGGWAAWGTGTFVGLLLFWGLTLNVICFIVRGQGVDYTTLVFIFNVAGTRTIVGFAPRLWIAIFV